MKYLGLSPERIAILYRVGSSLTPILNYFARSSPDLTDHGSEHSSRLINYLNQLFSANIKFTEEEKFVLYLAAWLHDLGCINTREYHNLESERMVRESKSLKNLLEKVSDEEKEALRKVIVNHTGKFNENGREIRNKNLNVLKMAAILRFIDACDISRRRAPKMILEFLNDIPLTNRVFWLAHSNIVDVVIKPKNNNVDLIVYVKESLNLEKIFKEITRTERRKMNLSQKNYERLLIAHKCNELIGYIKEEVDRVNRLIKGINISFKISRL